MLESYTCSEYYSIVHSLEHLTKHSFQGIKEPLDQIPKILSKDSFHLLFEGGGQEPLTTLVDVPGSHCSHQQSPHNSHPISPRKMAQSQPWLAQDVVAVLGETHDLPNRPKKTLPKYDPNKNASLEDHIKRGMLVVHLFKVQFEYIVHRLFPYIFVGKAYAWYISLQP